MTEKPSIYGSAFWLCVGIFFSIGSARLGLYDGNPGPGLFPFMAGVVLAALSMIDLLSAAKTRFQEETSRKNFFPAENSLKKLGSALFALFAYLLLLDPMGFLVTTFLFIVYLLRFIEPLSWGKNLTVSILTVLFSHLLFVYLLQMRLPRGIFGI